MANLNFVTPRGAYRGTTQVNLDDVLGFFGLETPEFQRREADQARADRRLDIQDRGLDVQQAIAEMLNETRREGQQTNFDIANLGDATARRGQDIQQALAMLTDQTTRRGQDVRENIAARGDETTRFGIETAADTADQRLRLDDLIRQDRVASDEADRDVRRFGIETGREMNLDDIAALAGLREAQTEESRQRGRFAGLQADAFDQTQAQTEPGVELLAGATEGVQNEEAIAALNELLGTNETALQQLGGAFGRSLTDLQRAESGTLLSLLFDTPQERAARDANIARELDLQRLDQGITPEIVGGPTGFADDIFTEFPELRDALLQGGGLPEGLTLEELEAYIENLFLNQDPRAQ